MGGEMTTPHREFAHCPYCHRDHTQESAFGRWIRNNKMLDSYDGYRVADQDYFVRRVIKTKERAIHCMMAIEVKTFGAKLTRAQRETFYIQNALIRTIGTGNKLFKQGWAVKNVGLNTVKIPGGKKTTVRHYGYHTLTFEKLGPIDSAWIKWDGKHEITKDQLTDILRFELDPDTLKPMRVRLSHKTQEIVFEETTPLGFKTEVKVIIRS